MKVYERTENGITAHVSIREGLDEVNHAMMDGKRDAKEMSSITRTDFAIEYKDGRKVTLIQVDAPAAETEEGPEVWTGEATRFVTVKGKRYIVGTIVPAQPRTPGAKSWIPTAYVQYWSERDGKTFGATRSTSGNAKPGTVGRAIWDAVSRP